MSLGGFSWFVSNKITSIWMRIQIFVQQHWKRSVWAGPQYQHSRASVSSCTGRMETSRWEVCQNNMLTSRRLALLNTSNFLTGEETQVMMACPQAIQNGNEPLTSQQGTWTRDGEDWNGLGITILKSHR